jgi:hypothetical protein
MSIIRRGKETYLVRIYLGRDLMTRKRIEINETVHGPYSSAVEREIALKNQKYTGRLVKSSNMTLSALLEDYLESVRTTLDETTHDKYERYSKYFVQPHIGAIAINKIKPGNIQRFLNFLLDKKEAADGQK